MAPEVVKSEEYNQQCDMWSLGVIMYVMLAGVFPFRGESKEETIKLINNCNIEFKGTFDIRLLEPSWRRISEEGKRFIRRLLQYKPEKRPSAKEGLRDPWFQKFLEPNKESSEELFNGLKNLASFRTQMTFQKAVLTYIASQELTQNEEKELKGLFNSLDKDQNGIITKDELVEGFIKVGEKKSNAKVKAKEVMHRIDINQNGAIDYNEFLMANLVTREALTLPRLNKAFEFFDVVIQNIKCRMVMVT